MTYALRDSPAFDGSRWLESFEAAALPYGPWLATAGDGWRWTGGGTSGAAGSGGRARRAKRLAGPAWASRPSTSAGLPVPPKSRPPKLSLLRDWAGGHPTPNWAVWTATSREKQPCIEPNEHFGFSLVRPLERL